MTYILKNLSLLSVRNIKRHAMSFIIIIYIMLNGQCAVGQPVCEVTKYKELYTMANSVNRIVQDSLGMIWLATNNGICRYDGYGFDVFKAQPGDGLDMPSDNINKVYLSATGNLWAHVGTRAFLFDVDKCRYLDVMDQLEKALGRKLKVTKIRSMSNGTTWFLTTEGLCIKVDDRRPLTSARIVARQVGDDASIMCDERGYTWIIDSQRTIVYRNRRLLIFRCPFTSVTSSGGYTWMITRGGKLCYFDEARQRISHCRKYKLPAGDKKLYRLTGDRLVVSVGAKLYIINLKKNVARHNEVMCCETGSNAKDMREAIDGRLWVMNDKAQMTVLAQGKVAQSIDLSQKDVYYWHEDQAGTMWFVSHSGDIYYIEYGSSEVKRHSASDADLKMGLNFTADSHDNVWFRNETGIYRLSFRQRHYSIIQEMNDDLARALAVDNRGRLWVAWKNQRAIGVYDQQGRRIGYLSPDGAIRQQPSHFEMPVYALHRAADGTMWAGCKPGALYRFVLSAGDGYTATRYDKLLNDNEIYAITSDAKGRLWVGTHKGGVNCITGAVTSSPKAYNCNAGMPGYTTDINADVRCITTTRDGYILIGTQEGLVVGDIKSGDPRRFVFHQHLREIDRKNSLSCSAITGVYVDTRKRIFVSTESGGVNQLLTKDVMAESFDFAHYNVSTGLGIDMTRNMFEDKGHLWISSMGRLVDFCPDTPDNVSRGSYLIHDHLQNTEALTVRTADGRWAIGLTKGVLLIDMGQLKQHKFEPPLVITRVQAENSDPAYDTNSTDTVLLHPGETNVNISFATLNYSGSSDINYMYQFDGQKWIYLGTGHSVMLSGLTPGHYTLNIRSTNGEGAWVDSMRTLTIVVQPRFTETLLFRVLVVLVVLMTVGGGVAAYMYIKRMERQRKQLLDDYMQLLVQLDSNDQEDGQPLAGETAGKEERTVAPVADDTNLEKNHTDDKGKIRLKEEDQLFMSKIMEFVEEHIADSDVTMNDMADAAATSRSGLNRKMKQLFGITPLDFLKEARIRKAMDMLNGSSANVNEVAYKCGFSDPKYFSKCFKQVTDLTPTEYRNRKQA